MTLNQLLRLLDCEPTGPAAGSENALDPPVTAVTEDSRRVVPGALFVAAAGEHVDGHTFASQAVAAGALAILGDRDGVSELEGVPYLRVRRPRQSVGLLAHALAGDPSKAMTVAGITGTNGKSSSVLMTQAALKKGGRATAAGRGAFHRFRG